MQNKFEDYLKACLTLDFGQTVEEATPEQLFSACGKAVCALNAAGTAQFRYREKRACYFSAEFMLGRLLTSNLLNTGVLDEARAFLEGKGRSLDELENVEDAALGNGGLGRLAACLLDSAACTDIPLDGYGIRYRYGLFRQSFTKNEQTESPDNWLNYPDPFGVRHDEDTVTVDFADMKVLAVPYDYAVIGSAGRVNRLRLFQCEPVQEFNLQAFCMHDYAGAFNDSRERAVSAVLYPPDDSEEGRVLRIRQQYFFSSASLQSILKELDSQQCSMEALPERIAVQLNDTHPVVAIPELIRLLSLRNIPFEQAFDICVGVFAYTNHTVMSEALEKWEITLYERLLPEIAAIVKKIDARLRRECRQDGEEDDNGLSVVRKNQIHMADLAIYCSHSVNGVASIHTGILKSKVFPQWYECYPERFRSITNGVTTRRWLAVANPRLTQLLKEKLGEDIVEHPEKLKALKQCSEDTELKARLLEIKKENKRELANYLNRTRGISIDPDSVLSVQIKRVHEYKRQLMNALSAYDIYCMLKSGLLTEMPPVTLMFAGKAAMGYRAAKAIIQYINTLAAVINGDKSLDGRLKIVYADNYNVSLAEKIIPAAEISEQLSLAGTEASGTGNMKLMMNGAVTLGTYDGANIEIVEQAGTQYNYVFGLRANEVEALRDSYNPKELYATGTRIKRAADTLLDEAFSDGGSGCFKELYDSLLKSSGEQPADKYFVLRDLTDYTDTRLRAIRNCADGEKYALSSLMNIASSGIFSSDRTVGEYATQIWDIQK